MKLSLLLLALCVCQVLCGSDEEECSSGECKETTSYCEGSECCATPSCNQCVDTCRSSCAQSSCDCVSRCLPCASRCATRSCRSRCSSKPVTVTESKPQSSPVSSDVKVDTNPKVDVNTSLDLANQINNSNHIHSPVNVSSNNINNVHVSTGSMPSRDVKIVTTKEETKVDESCCMVIPPKQCQYEDRDLKCAQNPYKICSDTCRSPIIVPHPVPRPYPVPQPYPVAQRVPVPVHIPVPKPVYVQQKVLVPQPYPVIKQVPVPHPVPFTQVVKEPVYVPQKVVVPQPYPVPQPIIKQVLHPVPVPVTQEPVIVRQPVLVPHNIIKTVPVRQVVKELVYIREPVPYPVQQPCPLTIHRGSYIPTCSTVQAARQYIGTSQQFLLDTTSTQSNVVVPQCSVLNKPPWFVCEKQQLQDCGECTFCGGQYNPQLCIQSTGCSASCQQILRSVNFPSGFERKLSCTTYADGRIKCQ